MTETIMNRIVVLRVERLTPLKSVQRVLANRIDRIGGVRPSWYLVERMLEVWRAQR